MDADIIFNGNMLEMFRPTSEVEVKQKIIKSPNKSCDLDPLPTWILKKCVDQLLPLITAIVNRSMDESVMLNHTVFETSYHNPTAEEIWVG